MAHHTNEKKPPVRPRGKKITTSPAVQPLQNGERRLVPVSQIDFSPLNHRRFFSAEKLAAFAEELKIHGILNDLTLRPGTSGRFELVAGERRLRAAKLAGLTDVPATIRNLTDHEVREIQLAENLQREDPHPLDVAYGIAMLQEDGKNIDEIAARLGKSKAFVYNRIKLLSLTDGFREMFFADVLTTAEAVEIASLSADSQEELFADHCSDWKKEKGFRFDHLYRVLSQYRCDLKKAPFDTKDAALLPGVGACTGCPFNSASLKTLFPELAKQAVCSNRSCFSSKCTAQLTVQLMAALRQQEPQAVLLPGSFTEEVLPLLQAIPGAADLLVHDRYDVRLVSEPTEPAVEDFVLEDDGEETEFDREAYDIALLEYLVDLDEYNEGLGDGSIRKGLLISPPEIRCVFFSTHRFTGDAGGQKISAKEVQQAIKAKTATPELLTAEMERLQTTEERAKVLDRVKVQGATHLALSEGLKEGIMSELTTADRLAERLLVYQSLDYGGRSEIDAALFAENGDAEKGFLEKLAGLASEQYAYLLRRALAGKSDSKEPTTPTGRCLFEVATAAGIDTAALETAQQAKAEIRAERVESRLLALQKLVKKLKKAQ